MLCKLSVYPPSQKTTRIRVDECEYTPPYRNGGCAALCVKELLRGDVTGWASYTSGGYLGTTGLPVGCSIERRKV